MGPKRHAVDSNPAGAFDVEAYLESDGRGRTVVRCRPGAVVFAEGDSGHDVRYVRKGAIELSVISRIGEKAVVATLGPGDFFGEGILAGQTVRIATATAVAASTVVIIAKQKMERLLHTEAAFSHRFLTFMLKRNLRIEAELVDRLFSSSEKRLARTLWLLARYGEPESARVLPRISQETLAEMIGASRSRVSLFMHRFRKLGLIEYNGGLKIKDSLLSIVLHD
jgi:CRP/FNR family transcriptional regulator, cyclic AMP receptor protein